MVHPFAVTQHKARLKVQETAGSYIARGRPHPTNTLEACVLCCGGGGGAGGGLSKVSSAKVSVKPLVDLPCLTQPPAKSYWIATTQRHIKVCVGGGGGDDHMLHTRLPQIDAVYS